MIYLQACQECSVQTVRTSCNVEMFFECPGLIPIESTRKDTPVVRRTVLGVRIEYSLWTSQTLRFCFVKENRIISATVLLLLLLLPISI